MFFNLMKKMCLLDTDFYILNISNEQTEKNVSYKHVSVRSFMTT